MINGGLILQYEKLGSGTGQFPKPFTFKQYMLPKQEIFWLGTNGARNKNYNMS